MCPNANNQTKVGFSFFILALLLFPVACASVDPVVKIGLVGPFEGRYRAIGYDAIYSARLAVREINQAGGIGGYRVALVALDDSGDPQLARETAASLVIDPAVVAVVGHWRPETTAVAAPIYAEAELPFIPMGETPFAATDPALLPPEFHQAYEAVTPFDETAGPFAGSTYDAFQLLWQALENGKEMDGSLDRAAVEKGLAGLEYDGLTGNVYVPVLVDSNQR
jgi:ABC-type branched-subunit amino acid transport system substrate-binding protein